MATFSEHYTYQLEPKEDERFLPAQVKQIVNDVFTEKLQGQEYDNAAAQQQALEISEIIKRRCKNLKLNRFKIIVQVVIGELAGQGIRITSKCIWNSTHDNYASVSYQTNNIFAAAMVFGCYTE
jgi:hypothetical protein